MGCYSEGKTEGVNKDCADGKVGEYLSVLSGVGQEVPLFGRLCPGGLCFPVRQ